jgi:hypothetical protein
MRWFCGALLATVLWCIASGSVRAGDDEARAILNKAIKVMGGEEKLKKVVACSWSSSGFAKVGGRVNEVIVAVTFKGLNQVRREYGSKGPYRLMVLDGDKGWYLSRGQYQPMDGDAIANEKRNIYLQVIPTLLVPLKSHGFKYEHAGEDEVDDKPASILKVTGPDGKDFMLYFDKQSGLPVKQVVKSIGADGKEQTEEVTFGGYKDLGGIKKATSIEVRNDSPSVSFIEINDFKVLDDVPPATFARPN